MLSLETPEGLLRVAFFYNGKNFCLRGEQRGLKFSHAIEESIATVNKEAKCTMSTQSMGLK